MAEQHIRERAVRVDGTSVLAALCFLTLTVLALAERFADVPAAVAAYAGAVYVLGRDATR